MTTQATIRILKELREFHDHPDNNLYVHTQPLPPTVPQPLPPQAASCSASRALIGPLTVVHQVHYYESNVTQFNALLIGPEDTPYEYGMFEFLLRFPKGLSPPRPPRPALAIFDVPSLTSAQITLLNHHSTSCP